MQALSFRLLLAYWNDQPFISYGRNEIIFFFLLHRIEPVSVRSPLPCSLYVTVQISFTVSIGILWYRFTHSSLLQSHADSGGFFSLQSDGHTIIYNTSKWLLAMLQNYVCLSISLQWILQEAYMSWLQDQMGSSERRWVDDLPAGAPFTEMVTYAFGVFPESLSFSRTAERTKMETF